MLVDLSEEDLCNSHGSQWKYMTRGDFSDRNTVFCCWELVVIVRLYMCFLYPNGQSNPS